MTLERLNEIEAREKKATEGPYRVQQVGPHQVAIASPSLDRVCVFHATGRRTAAECRDDAVAMANASNDRDALLAHVKALPAERDALAAKVASLKGISP